MVLLHVQLDSVCTSTKHELVGPGKHTVGLNSLVVVRWLHKSGIVRSWWLSGAGSGSKRTNTQFVVPYLPVFCIQKCPHKRQGKLPVFVEPAVGNHLGRHTIARLLGNSLHMPLVH